MKLIKFSIAALFALSATVSTIVNATNEVLGDFNGDGNLDAFNQSINTGETSSLSAKVGVPDLFFHKSWTTAHPDIPEISDWSAQIYGAFSADLNSSPGDELLLLGKKKIILLHGDVITPIVIFPEIKNAIISWSSSGVATYSAFNLDVNPDDFNVQFADFDGDGDAEIFLQNLNNGGDSYVVSGNGLVSQTLSNGYLGTDWSTGSNIELVDANGDGRADMRITDANGNVTIVYASTTGTFVTEPVPLAPDWASKFLANVADDTLVEPIVPTQEAVGALEGQGGVSGGSASYSIPVALPPGRAGMQPGVSLNYSSRGGNGLAGVGWSVGAGSSISRCSATQAQDGFTASLQYDATRDRLCLDGQRLVLVSGIYGASGATYRTEMDSFALVAQTGGINSSTSEFEVKSKDGRTTRYGASADSRHVAEGRAETLTWAITDVRDPSGNMMTYHYTARGDGEFTLDHINYTGEDGVSGSDGRNGSGGNRQVLLTYENRTDALGNSDYRTSYQAGGKTRQTQRLKAIKTYYDAILVREYKLSYGNASLSSGRTLLRSVQECAYQNSIAHCLPATTFDWQEAAPNYVLEPVEFDQGGTTVAANNFPYIAEIIPQGDIDGDGVRDWPGVDVDVNSDDIVPQSGLLVNAERQLVGTHSEQMGDCIMRAVFGFSKKCLSADFNQDGKTDYFKIDSTNGNSILIRHAGTATWVDTTVDLTGGPNNQIISLSDVNGDGWPDLSVYESEVSLGTPKVYLYPNSRNAAAPFSESTRVLLYEITVRNPLALYSYNQTVSETGDMDGNGTVDFITYVAPNLKSYQGVGRPTELLLSHVQSDGTISFTRQLFDGFIDLANSQFVGESYTFHDINGDGLTDWLAIGRDLKLNYKLNQGGTFAANWTPLDVQVPMRDHMIEPTGDEAEAFMLPVWEKTMAMDYDGNGKPELLYADTVFASACAQHIDRIHGTQWLCDEALWELADIEGNTLGMEPIPGGRKDVSARTYKAIYFDENADGSITPRLEDTDIVAAPVERTALDVTGDGLTDVVTTFTCKISGCAFNSDATVRGGQIQNGSLQTDTVYINRNVGASLDENGYETTDVIKKVSNGLKVENQWTYRPLGSDQFDQAGVPFYDPDHEYLFGDINAGDNEYFHFGSSMMVVAEHQTSDGIGGLNATRYQYRGAVFNSQGRGFQGFRTIMVDNPNGVRSVTDFHQRFPLAGKIESARTCLVTDDETCSLNPLSRTEITQTAKTTANSNIHWVIPTKTVAETFALDNRLQLMSSETTDIALIDTDNYGNIKKTITTVNKGFSTIKATTENTYGIDEGSWWINKLTQTLVTTETLSASGVHQTALDPKKQLKTDLTYYSASRLPDIVTTTPMLGGGEVSHVDTDYNAYGLPTSVKTYESLTDVRQVTTNYTNNGTTQSADGYFVHTVTNDLNQTVTTQTYPEHGQVKQVTDANGLISTSNYDAFGRIETATPPTGTGQPAHSRFAWCDGSIGCDGMIDSNIQYKVTTYQAGSPTSTAYKDKFNRVILAKTEGFNGADVFVRTEYDYLGRTTFTAVPSFSYSETKGTHFNSFDALGRALEKLVDQPFGQSMRVNYNYQGRRTDITATDVLGGRILTMSRTHSGNGQLMQTTDAKGGVTQYAYDAMGNPIVLQDANGHPITAEYNALGQKKWIKDPNMGQKDFTYTGFGEVDTELDANGDSYDYDYDKLGRLLVRKLNAQNEATYSYDTQCKGAPDSETRDDLPTGESYSRTYAYDGYCRPISVITTIDGTIYTMGTQYDANHGRVKAVTYPTGLTAKNSYNDQGYLTNVSNAASGYIYQEATDYDARGQLTAAKQANGILTETIEYAHETGQMEAIYTNTTAGGNQRHRIEYDYDGFGNLNTQTVETMEGIDVITSIETYGYDDLHRLISSGRTIAGIIQPTINYNYDAVGNLILKDDYASAYVYGDITKSTGNAGTNAVRSITKAGGGTATFSYDLNGNLTSGDGKTIIYNAFNKPISITKNTISSTFRYGADQLRYKQIKTGLPNGTETTIYIEKAYEEVSYNGETKKRVYLGDAIITETIGGTDPGHKIGFVHRDRLGSVVTITDENGNVVENKNYDPFGKPRKGTMDLVEPPTLKDVALASNFSLYTNRGFTDHEHLDDAELIHMNGRVYDYNLGRFLSVDPVIQDSGNSQSVNPYSYIMNNPLAGTDPSGYVGQAAEDEQQIEQLEITKDTKILLGNDGNAYVDVGGGDLIKIDTFTVTNNGISTSFNIDITNPSSPDNIGASLSINNKNINVPSSGSSGSMSFKGNNSDQGSTDGDPIGGPHRGVTEDGIPFIITVTKDQPTSTQGVEEPPDGKIDLGNLPSLLGSSLALTDVQNTIGMRQAGVSFGQWQGVNGKWYNLAWGGNQWTGARSIPLFEAHSFRLLGRGVAFLSVGVELSELGAAIWNNNSFGILDSLVDLGAMIPGFVGGLPGFVFSTSYSITDNTFGPTLSSAVADGACYLTSNC